MHLYYLWHSSKLGTIASFITEYIIHHILDIILKCILPGQQPFSERLIGHNEILVGTLPALGIQIHKIWNSFEYGYPSALKTCILLAQV